MIKNVLTLTLAIVFAWQGLSFAGSSVDALIQKLEDKGILTKQEAYQVKGEIASDEKASQEASFKTLLPDWVNGVKITGDFRLRDQIERRKVAGGSPSSHLVRNRVRLRARLNVEDQINDKVKVVFGIATNGENSVGTGNPRSSNLTFGGNAGGESSFSKQSIVINKAYAVYTPASYLTVMGGKMDNPVWEPASLLWDPNITPEGGAIQLQKKLNDYITPFETTAFYVLKDAGPSLLSTSSKTDPYMYVTQGGLKGNLTEKVYYKAAGTYYGVENPNHLPFDYRPSPTSGSSAGANNTNTVSSSSLTSTYANSYYLVGGAVELGMNDPFGEYLPAPIYVPQIGAFGQYFKNLNPAHQSSAWQIGGYVGSSALNGFGTWKLQSYYKVLERDSWLDIFPDADFYSGATNTKGWRTELDIGLAKNTWFALSWYRTNVFKYIPNLLNGASGSNGLAYSKSAPENLIQADLNFKF